MSAAGVRRTLRFRLDLEQIIDDYRTDAGTEIAVRFVKSFEQALTRITAFPSLGSHRFTEFSDLADIRAAAVPSFPYSIFYLFRDEIVVGLRVLHHRRDLPELLREPDA
ncbi:MAG: type II toxin-antitoxin system RelE/ParE family toxin [Aeromicrobium sp.]|uniref:type II toxin-antitoxin system RelE/ParE family toxin n=1 Tax=Aeromicrobium sp. TaxID=1871063 RepID=UPI0039E38685